MIYSTYSLLLQGRPQNLGGGGGKNFFFDFEICMSPRDMLRMASPCGLLGGFGGMSPEKFFKMVQFGAFWCIFGSDLLL